MNPNPKNLEVAFSGRLSDKQKTIALIANKAELDSNTLTLEQLIEKSMWYASPFVTGKPELGDEENSNQHSGYETPLLTIKADRPLALQFYIYTPPQYPENHSLLAKWLEPIEGERPRLVYAEYLSARNFVPNIAAYKPEAEQIAGLLAETLNTYHDAFMELPPETAMALGFPEDIVGFLSQ